MTTGKNCPGWFIMHGKKPWNPDKTLKTRA